jgi:hypothetical protein
MTLHGSTMSQPDFSITHTDDKIEVTKFRASSFNCHKFLDRHPPPHGRDVIYEDELLSLYIILNLICNYCHLNADVIGLRNFFGLLKYVFCFAFSDLCGLCITLTSGRNIIVIKIWPQLQKKKQKHFLKKFNTNFTIPSKGTKEEFASKNSGLKVNWCLNLQLLQQI